MLAQRRRRCINIGPTLRGCLPSGMSLSLLASPFKECLCILRRPPWSTYPHDPDGCSDESRYGRRWASEIMLYIISPYSDCVRVDIASRRFLCNHGNIATEGSPHCVTVDVCDSWWYLELVFWNFGWKIGCRQIDGNVICLWTIWRQCDILLFYTWEYWIIRDISARSKIYNIYRWEPQSVTRFATALLYFVI